MVTQRCEGIMKVDVKVDELENKFYAVVEGKECVVNFRPVDANALELYRTFVPQELRDRGIAAELVEYALKYAQSQNKKVIPTCSYIQWYIDNHPEWSIIVER